MLTTREAKPSELILKASSVAVGSEDYSAIYPIAADLFAGIKDPKTSLDIIHLRKGIQKTLEGVSGFAALLTDEKDLLISTEKGILKRWDISSGESVTIFSDPSCTNVKELKWLSDQQIICLDVSKVKLWDLEKNTANELFDMGEDVFSLNTNQIVVKDNKVIGLQRNHDASVIHIYDLKTQTKYEFNADKNIYRSLAVGVDVIALQGARKEEFFGHVVDFYDFKGEHLYQIANSFWPIYCCALPTGEFYCFKQIFGLQSNAFLVNPRLENALVKEETLDWAIAHSLQFNPYSGHLIAYSINGHEDRYLVEFDLGYKEKYIAELTSSVLRDKTFEFVPGIVAEYLGVFSKSKAKLESSEEDKEMRAEKTAVKNLQSLQSFSLNQ